MMAANSSKFPAWFIFFVVLFLHVSVDCSSAEGKSASSPCLDGTYEHDGTICCLCSAGMYLKEHCTRSQNRKCESCDEGMFSSHANNQESCEHCTSCAHPNANLEVDVPCTRATNAKCRCKKDHYCNSGTETCQICYPCKECTEGIKVACTVNNNTVCNDKVEGGNNTGMIVGITLLILVIILVLGIALFKRKHDRDRRGQNIPIQRRNGSGEAHDEERAALEAPLVELQPHLSDIADEIGWKDMQVVAMRSNISSAIIESCQLNHPHNVQEQTLELLQIWEEKQGREASRNLIRILKNSDKVRKAEKVMSILNGQNLPA